MTVAVYSRQQQAAVERLGVRGASSCRLLAEKFGTLPDGSHVSKVIFKEHWETAISSAFKVGAGTWGFGS